MENQLAVSDERLAPSSKLTAQSSLSDAALDLSPHKDSERGVMFLNCYKCTRETPLPFSRIEDANAMAALMGWVIDEGKLICPRCPAVRKSFER